MVTSFCSVIVPSLMESTALWKEKVESMSMIKQGSRLCRFIRSRVNPPNSSGELPDCRFARQNVWRASSRSYAKLILTHNLRTLCLIEYFIPSTNLLSRRNLVYTGPHRGVFLRKDCLYPAAIWPVRRLKFIVYVSASVIAYSVANVARR